MNSLQVALLGKNWGIHVTLIKPPCRCHLFEVVVSRSDLGESLELIELALTTLNVPGGLEALALALRNTLDGHILFSLLTRFLS